MKNRFVDTLPLCSALSSAEVKVAQKMNIPMFQGVLYENLDDGFGNPILKEVGRNTVVVGGAILALERLCNVQASWDPATLNSIYGINEGVSGNPNNTFISLFGIGTGGSGLTLGSKVPKNIKNRDVPDLIPMRVGESITDDQSDKYYLKKQNDDGTYNWYLKEFDSPITIKTCWKDSLNKDLDGTEVTEEIYNSSRTDGLTTFAEAIIQLNINDGREYFEKIGNLTTARFNSIGLYTGEKVLLEDGNYEYINVRLFSYLNLDNRSLSEKTERRYTYRILSLV